MKTLLEVTGLAKDFDGTQVLKGVHLTVYEGEMVAIMGRSGSGKSTLLYGISGMDKPTSGSVSLFDREITSLDDDQMSELRLRHMGFVFQHAYLLHKLSVMDNIVLPGFKAGALSRDDVNQRGKALMEKTGISSVAAHDPGKVSGGQLQRAAICRALINDPDILFADEPTGALNSRATQEIMDIFNRINREGTTVVLVTHDAKVAARADRIIFLVDGLIQDELALGKHEADEQAQAAREKKIFEWLEHQGF
ncbi:ABC transporter ATP-binding protein [Anoxynatronum buryatiense]|uniref:ABC transport system ATP-binding protein n=1 Tax=Anoxynatronum buryatiense TaxID=489973 RepID=A0AA45WXF4_9CLOT|nr:ABC transporter ATP-binding protein [Anoxynatronum buryatiense]SMP63375.1 putative ABC transport system ATP-binding protein [Anoxynatronum buryatiense]